MSKTGAQIRRERERAAAPAIAARKARAAAQKAAKESRAYEDFPGTPADLVAFHRQLKQAFLERQGAKASRMTAPRTPEFPWDRFFAFVPQGAVDECWEWQGSIATTGYGRITRRGRMYLAHRLMHERMIGPIPEGYQIDHLCRNRRCVNPAHLEAVTQRENILRGDGYTARAARKTHCLNGHPFAGENLAYDRTGRRVCVTCKRARSAELTRQRRERRLNQRSAA